MVDETEEVRITPIGTGEKVDKSDPLEIMIEPAWPYLVSGIILVIGGLIKGLITLLDSDFPDLLTGISLTVSIILLVGGVLIFKHVRDAGWAVLVVIFINLVIVAFSYDQDDGHMLGGASVLTILSAFFQLIIFGIASIIPPVFGLKKGWRGKF